MATKGKSASSACASSNKGLKNFLGLSVREMSARFDTTEDAQASPSSDSASPGSPTRKISKKIMQDRLGDLSDSEEETSNSQNAQACNPAPETMAGQDSTKAGATASESLSEKSESSNKQSVSKKSDVRTRTRIPSPETRRSMPREQTPDSPKCSPKSSPKTPPKPAPKPEKAPSAELTDAEMLAVVDKMYAFHDDEPDSLDSSHANSRFGADATEKEKGILDMDLKDFRDKPESDLEADLLGQIIPDTPGGEDVPKTSEPNRPVQGNKRAGSSARDEEKVPKRKLKASGEDMGSIPDLSLGLRDLSKLPVKEPEIVPTRTWVTGTKKSSDEQGSETKDSITKSKLRSKLPSPTRSSDDSSRLTRDKSPRRSPSKALQLPDLEQIWKEIQQTKIYMEEDIQKSSECMKILSATCGLRQADRMSHSREYDLDLLGMSDSALGTSQLEETLAKLGDADDITWEDLIGTDETLTVISDIQVASKTTKSGKKDNSEMEIKNLQNSVHKLKEDILSRQKAEAKKDAFLIKMLKAWADVKKQWKVHETRSKLLIESVNADKSKLGIESTEAPSEDVVRKSIISQAETSAVRGQSKNSGSVTSSKGVKSEESFLEELRSKLSTAEEKAVYYQRELEQSVQQNKGLQDWLNSISKQKDSLESKISELQRKLTSLEEEKVNQDKNFKTELEQQQKASLSEVETTLTSKLQDTLRSHKTSLVKTQTTLIEKHQKQLHRTEIQTNDVYKERKERAIMDIIKAMQRQQKDFESWKADLVNEDKWTFLIEQQLQSFQSKEPSNSEAKIMSRSDAVTSKSFSRKAEVRQETSTARAQTASKSQIRSTYTSMEKVGAKTINEGSYASAVKSGDGNPPKTAPKPRKTNAATEPMYRKTEKVNEATLSRPIVASSQIKLESEPVAAKKLAHGNKGTRRPTPGYAASTRSRDLAIGKLNSELSESKSLLISESKLENSSTHAQSEKATRRTSTQEERNSNASGRETTQSSIRSNTYKDTRTQSKATSQRARCSKQEIKTSETRATALTNSKQ